MQNVPVPLIRVGVSYRVHPPDGPDLIGTVKRKNIFKDGDIRYLLYHIQGIQKPPDWMCSINPDTSTFYITEQNKWVRRIIASKTGRLVQSPLLTHYF